MRIWIDLANSPHVPFFRALITRFEELGHRCEISARDFAETVALAHAAGFSPQVIGAHGGKKYSGKATNLASRARALASWARGRRFDLAVSHNSYSQILAAKLLRLKSVTLMDYEYQPANHLAFRLSSRVVVPRSFPETRLRRFGARAAKVRRYNGTKEDVYLAGFEPDENFHAGLCKLGIKPDNVVVLMRPPARVALYHRFENKLFDYAIAQLRTKPGVQIILLPRNAEQRRFYSDQAGENLLMPAEILDGANLIAASDLVISAGGTMNREAAALGVPAASIYAGRWAAVDEELVREGRLSRISAPADIEALQLCKKKKTDPRRAVAVRDEVVKLILA
jgi:predicted glycosyltransferase